MSKQLNLHVLVATLVAALSQEIERIVKVYVFVFISEHNIRVEISFVLFILHSTDRLSGGRISVNVKAKRIFRHCFT